MSVFKACDIRGVADTELCDEAALPIARAIGVKLTGKAVVVGGDFRLSTPRLKSLVIKELAESGCRVIDIGAVATPMFYFAIARFAADGGVMVTASHNPAEYNGFKLVVGDLPIREAELEEISALANERAEVRGTGTVEKIDIADEYIAHTARKASPGKLKLVLDAGNGAASAFAPSLYRRLGFLVTELFCTPDGTFPNRPPNPAYPRNLKKLADKVKETGADLGIAFDGDGDRVAFVDETGRAVDNDDILALLAKQCLESGSGAIIYDAKCSMVVPEQIAAAGGRPVMARAGHTFSKQAFLRESALFAGEISGHFFFRDLGYDDGMFAGLRMCAYVAEKGPLSVLIDAIPNYILTAEARVRYPHGDKETVLREVAERLSAYRLNRIDGVRLEFADGWGMIRSSVTEPLFTLRFEAKTSQRLREIQRVLIGALPRSIQADVMLEVEKVNGVR